MTRLLAVFLLALALHAQADTRILIAYHSESGNTEKLAQSIREGAASLPHMAVTLRKAADLTDDDILHADGIVLGSPIQWSTLSADAKRSLDKIGAVLGKASKSLGDGRTAAAFCTGGGIAMGKDLTRISILSAFLTMRFTVIGGVDPYDFGTLGPSATTGPDDPGISDKERAEARQFGIRFARLTRQFTAQK
jgi:NAD(P)H dehydrogenase (quinone)